MRIVFTVDSMGNGGAEKVVALLSNQFVIDGHDVYIICTGVNKSASFYEINDQIKMFFLEQNTTLFKMFLKVKQMKKIIKNINPHVVISFLPHVNVYTYFALKNTKIPFIVSERNNPKTDPKGFLLRKAKEYVFKKSNLCIFQTQSSKDYYKKIKEHKKVVIHNPFVDNMPDKYIYQRKKTIISVGRLTKQKNLFFLIDCFQKILLNHSDYVLQIYGNGPLKEDLERYVANRNLEENIVFKGVDPDWAKKEKNATAFVLSSIYEGMPNALAEAMFSGIPSISSDCEIGGPRELIENEVNGLLYKTNDVDEVVKCLNAIISDPTLGQKFYDNNKKIVSNYSLKHVTNEWYSAIERILK